MIWSCGSLSRPVDVSYRWLVYLFGPGICVFGGTRDDLALLGDGSGRWC